MEDIKEVYSVGIANKFLLDGYILFNTHLLPNGVIVYILIKNKG